jgi:nitrogen fixation protein NifU and related proteins
MGDLDFWQKHSLSFLEMALRADKRERLRPASGHGLAQGACGDTVEIFIQVRDDCIGGASFETDGCLYTIACANTVVHLVEGKSLQYAQNLEPESIHGFLQTLPQEEFHCAELAVEALRMALANIPLMM